MNDAAAFAWLTAERARMSVAALALDLAPLGCRLLAIKGVHLAFCVAKAPTFRPMSDGDAVLLDAPFDDAVAAAVRAGWRVASDNWSTKGLARGDGTTVDLHRMPLPPFFGRMRLESVARRARAAPSIGPNVVVPDAADAAVISLGNWVKDSFGRTGSDHARIDLGLLIERTGLDASTLADRLREHRLRRVGLLAMHALSLEDPQFRPWLDALRPTPLERRWAALAHRAILAVATRHHYASFVLVRSAGDGPLDASLSVGFGLARWARDATRRMRGDPRTSVGWVPRS